MIFSISHADGSIKFWDASGCSLTFLYKLRTNRLFDLVQPITNKDNNVNSKSDSRASRTNSNTLDESVQQQMNSMANSNELNGHEYPFAIYSINLCGDGKYLIAAARGGHATLFKFTGAELDKADEGLGDLACMEIPILHRNLSGDHDEINPGGTSASANDPLTVRPSTDKKVRMNESLDDERSIVDHCLGIQKFTSCKKRSSSNGWISTRTRLPSIMVTH